MSDFAARQVLLFAGEMFAASLLVIALAWLGATARRASLRHLVWVASFAALIALPALTLVVPGAIVLDVPAPIETAPAAIDMPLASVPPPPPPVEAFSLSPGEIARTLAAMWLAGVVLIALRQMAAAFLLYRLRRDSDAHPFDDCELPSSARSLRHTLRLSRGDHGPLTWGIFRPVILLPNAAQFWPCERLAAVLHHEFAHVARRDGLSQLLGCAACALYWPNPFVWLGARAMRREAEIAADDAVIASGMTPSDYAGALLDMAREFRGHAAALAMAAPSALPARVKSILAPTQQRSGVTFMDILKTAAVALLATSALVAARPSFAQDAQAPAVEAAPPAPAMPAAPPTDAVPPVPPAPPAPTMEMDAPPAPPAPPAPLAARPDRAVRAIRLYETHHGRDLKRVRAEIELSDREVHDAMARVKPQIERAMVEVKAHEEALRQIAAMGPRLNAEIRQALAEARSQVARIKDADIRAKADAALARAQAGVDAAGRHESGTVILNDDDDSSDMDDGKDAK